MAIIDGVASIEVTIWIGGRPAFEYADLDTNNKAGEHDTKISSKFIQCRNGEQFTIHVRVNANYDHHQPVPHTLNLAAYIDGQWIRGELCRENQLKDGPFRLDIKERVARARDGTVVKQAFKFAGVTTVDDNCNWRMENEREQARDLGLIELRVFRVDELGSSNFNPGTGATRLAEVAEKSLKGRAISHGTQFGGNLDANIAPHYRDVKRLPTDAGPFATFRFAYRSREDLYKESIITREQNEALKRAEDARRQGSTRNQAPPTIITKDKMNELREQAVMRLRNLGFEPRRFVGHRERARARASVPQDELPRENEVRGSKREAPKKGEDLPASNESKKRKVAKIIDLTFD